MDGWKKAKYTIDLAKKINAEKIIAYSDSMWDLPLLESADFPVAVCPDKKLKKLSLARGWEII